MTIGFVFFVAGCGVNEAENKDQTIPRTEESTKQQEAVSEYTIEEVAQHNTPEDCWTAINGEVANITSFFGKHPGGDENLGKACGKEATEIFESIKKHDPNGYETLKNFTIGMLKK